jgi:hypothetical protein
MALQGHIDIFNFSTGLFGAIGHTIWDLGVGTLLNTIDNGNTLLDPR